MDLRSKITGVQHIGIPTNDIEKSKQFYSTIGFETIYETVNEAANEKVAFMQLGNLVMEIYENGKAAMTNGAVDHVAVDVKDIEGAYEAAEKSGLKIIEGICSLPFWENGIKYFIVAGPNNEKIEFCERL